MMKAITLARRNELMMVVDQRERARMDRDFHIIVYIEASIL